MESNILQVEKDDLSKENYGIRDNLHQKYLSKIFQNDKRKKHKNINYRDSRVERYAYNDYVARKSLLDQIYLDSELSKSPFKGILRLTLLLGFVYSLNNTFVISPILTCSR